MDKIRLLHLAWKGKILADLQTADPNAGTHYSGIITISEKDYKIVREILVETLGKIRKLVEVSPSEKACVLSLDCYQLLTGFRT